MLFYLAERAAAALEGRLPDLITGMALVTPNPDFAGPDLPLA